MRMCWICKEIAPGDSIDRAIVAPCGGNMFHIPPKLIWTSPAFALPAHTGASALRNNEYSSSIKMAAKIKIIPSVYYLSISNDGGIEFEESIKNLSALAESKRPPADYELLLVFRLTQWTLSMDEIYSLVQSLIQVPDLFRDMMALLVLPGVNYGRGYRGFMRETKEWRCGRIPTMKMS